MSNMTDAGGGPGGPDGVATVADLEARLADTKARLADTGARLAAAETRLADTGARLTAAETRLADTEAGLADTEARLAAAQDQKLRALADLDNLRKRGAVQVERAEADARAQVARQWLPVVDNLERALEHAAADPRTIVEGIQAVRQQALGVLASLGFPRRDDTGATFDPVRHDAVATAYDDRVPPGTVVQVVRPGYGEPDRQLRPAQVVVAKAD
jgi:molecular chaperone GrpE